MDIVTPVGHGQRALIVASPRSGKTVLLKKIARAINVNHPEVHLIVLLVDERPEEVTDMVRSVEGDVVSSCFDEPGTRHIQVSEMVLERAKRLVEAGKDVVVLVDSLTRMSRAHNNAMKHSGKLLSGGIDANALRKPKTFFGTARAVQEGGSLTIIATVLVDTGSRMDQVIYEEFKGTGNMEIYLDRGLANRRIFPCFDVQMSGTRKDELILDPQEYRLISALRGMVIEMGTEGAIEALLERCRRTGSNAEMLMQLVKEI
jgi:transcription termination factor Rho